MKNRFSSEKADWSDTREKQYKQYCLDIAFQFGDKLDAIECTVFLTKNNERIEIATPYKSKTFWYETWLQLKNFYKI
ncbi:hypothetical protein [Paenibacillus wynnii]|uniref:Uncharacterized protein n=1 Tax=Paenibacillus wynnii TaxID=268407 RepID=A0A098M476_9BACL|nr:hypothetical protein [Paenibacillus wynnii]KGE16357.1 hypothetical protein PWYN_16555 [Paenibacillus wynnii]